MSTTTPTVAEIAGRQYTFETGVGWSDPVRFWAAVNIVEANGRAPWERIVRELYEMPVYGEASFERLDRQRYKIPMLKIARQRDTVPNLTPGEP